MGQGDGRRDGSTRPADDEYAPFYRTYTALVPEGDVLDTMEREGRAFVRLLHALPADRAAHRYAPDKWTLREMIGHVVDTERVFAHRALWFARAAAGPLPGFEQDDWVLASGADARTLRELADEMDRVREASLAFFRGLDAVAWERRGTANGVEFTVRAVAWIIIGHALHHRRVLEQRYLA